jgi:hypothetical protein
MANRRVNVLQFYFLGKYYDHDIVCQSPQALNCTQRAEDIQPFKISKEVA